VTGSRHVEATHTRSHGRWGPTRARDWSRCCVSLRRKKIDVDVRGRRLFSKWQKKSTQFSPSLEIVSTVTTYFSRIVAPPKHTPPRDMPPEVRQRGGRPKKTQRPEDATTGADANAYYDKMQTATYTKINVVTQRDHFARSRPATARRARRRWWRWRWWGSKWRVSAGGRGVRLGFKRGGDIAAGSYMGGRRRLICDAATGGGRCSR
jgi:hypothetical protein